MLMEVATMEEEVVSARRKKRREYMMKWMDKNGGAGREKARIRRLVFIDGLKEAGKYEEFLAQRREREKKYYHQDIEFSKIKAVERSRTYRANHWDRHVLRRARTRAKNKGLPFNIDQSDIVIPDICPVLGIPIDRQLENMNDNSPSLDRIRPSLGYVKGNIRVISQRANRLKCDGTAAEMLLIHKDLLAIEAS
jgi:hypothetical protein